MSFAYNYIINIFPILKEKVTHILKEKMNLEMSIKLLDLPYSCIVENNCRYFQQPHFIRFRIGFVVTMMSFDKRQRMFSIYFHFWKNRKNQKQLMDFLTSCFLLSV